jgi:hypothetical protein
MPEFFKIDGILQRCGYSATTIRQRGASSRRWSGSSLVSRAEAIKRLESLVNSKTGPLLVRLSAAEVLAELQDQPPDIPQVVTFGVQEVVEDRGRGLLRALSALIEVEKNAAIRTSNDGWPALVDLTMVLSGRNSRRSIGCVRAIVGKYIRKTKASTTGGGIVQQILPGKHHSIQTPTYVPTTLRSLLEFVLRIPDQLAESPCLEAAPIIARYYGGDDGAVLLDEILATMKNIVRGRMVNAASASASASASFTSCEVVSQSVEVDGVDDGSGGAAVLQLDDAEDTLQPTEEEVVGGEVSPDIEQSVSTTPPVTPIDLRPPSCPPAPIFIYTYQGDTTIDCLYVMRLVPKTAEFDGVTLYKIGRSKDASVRRLEVSADFSETHWVSLCIVLVRAGDLELYFHRELADYRRDLTRRRNGRALGVSREVFDLSSWTSSGEEELLAKIQTLAETAIHVQGGGGGGGGGGDTRERLRVLENNSENSSDNSSAISETAQLMKRRRLTHDELRLALEREKTLQVQAEAWKVDAEAWKVDAEARKSEAEARRSESESAARKSEALVKKFEILSRLPEDVQRSLAASINVWVGGC